MSRRSYNYYMRPQDRNGNNHDGAVGRGRSPRQASSSGSRGRRLDRSYDFHDMRNRHRYDERDRSNIERRSDPYHASKSSNQPYASSHHRSCDPPLSQYASSSRDHSYQRNSSHSHERSSSPDRHHRNVQNNDNNYWYKPSRPPRSFDGGASKHESYEHHPLASTNGAEMHRAPSLMRSNDFHRHNNAENYDNISCGGHMNNMNSYHSHCHQPQSRYDHPKSTSQECRPLASRQDFPSYPRSSQQRSWPTAPRFSNDHTVPELIQIAHANLAAMKPSLTAAFWNKVSKQMGTNRQASRYREQMRSHLNQIFEHTLNTLMLFSTKDLSQTIYSLAKLVDVLRKRNGKRCVEDTDVSLSGLLLNHDMTLNEDLFRSFASASRDKLHHFDARGLSNLAYAYALIGYVPEFDDESDLFDHIATQSAERSAEFSAQGTSNMVWAFATVDKPHALLFETMGNQVVSFKHLGDFKPQNLANTVWAFAKAGLNHPMLFEKVDNHIVRLDILYGFKPQELSITVWAYTTAAIHHPKLFEKVANRIIDLDSLDRFTPQNLSNTLWAYAKTGVSHQKLFDKVANHILALDSLDRFKPQELTNTVWAYVTAQIHYPDLFQKIANAAFQRRGEFNYSQNVANLLWSYATMDIVDKQLFLSFVPTAAKLIDTYNNQDFANIAWAYAVADLDASTLFNDVYINVCVEKEGGFENEALTQLHQWHLWQTKEKCHGGLPEELQKKCYEAFTSEEPRRSKLQDDVVAHLSSIGLEPKEEVLMDSGYRIDAIVEVNGKSVGVEVDGPSHFIGQSKSPLAKTILKRRQVPSIDGIELLSVPYWEWNKLGNDEVKKQEYLRELLKL